MRIWNNISRFALATLSVVAAMCWSTPSHAATAVRPPRNVTTFETAADLAATDWRSVASDGRATVILRGWTTAGDGRGGIFNLAPTNTVDPTNTLDTLEARANAAVTGRWKKVSQGNRVVRTLADLDKTVPAYDGEVVEVLGSQSEGDWGIKRPFLYRSSAEDSVSEVVRTPPVSVGRWIYPWDGDARVFGVFPEEAARDGQNSTNFSQMVVWSRATGIPIRLPAGKTYLRDTIDLGAVTEMSGYGTSGTPIQSELVITTAGASVISNVVGGTVLKNFSIRPLYLSRGKADSTSCGIRLANFQSDVSVRDVVINGLAYGIDSNGAFDCTFENITINARFPAKFGGGSTHNLIARVAARGNVGVYSPESDTRVTCSTYTAGSTNLTVSDGTAFSVGDVIRVSSATGIANTISAKMWWRRVTGVSGNDLTLDRGWPYAFTDGQFEFALGAGGYGFEVNSQNTVVACNSEWGAWASPLRVGFGPTPISAKGFHVEGWYVNSPGTNVVMVSGGNVLLDGSYLEAINCTIADAATVSVFDSTMGGKFETFYARDWDFFGTAQTINQAYLLNAFYKYSVEVDEVLALGVSFTRAPGSINYLEKRGAPYKAGWGGEYLRFDGLGRATFYGYAGIPTTGSFVAGDEVRLATNTLICTTSGTFNTTTNPGTYRIHLGSRVMLTDSTARAHLGNRVVVSISGVQHVVEESSKSSHASTTVSSVASIGDRWIDVASSSLFAEGYSGVIAFGATNTFEDFTVQRVLGNRLFLQTPLARSHSSGTTVEIGFLLTAASATDVPSAIPIVFTAPTFTQPLVANSSGSVSWGIPTTQTALALKGNASGVRALTMERDGVGKIGFGVAAGALNLYDETGAKQIGYFDGSSASLVSWYVGANAVSGSPRTSRILSESSTGANVAGGSLQIRPGAGTGTATPTSVVFALPESTGSSGTTQQTNLVVLTFSIPATPTAGDLPILASVFSGGAWSAQRRVAVSNISGLDLFYLRP